jgi:AsmA-like protein
MTIRAARWAIVVIGGLLVTLAIVAGAGSRTATLRQLVVGTLADRLDSDVELESFSVDTFPTVHITGTGLVLRLKNRRDVPPLVTIRSFSLDGGLIGLVGRPRRFRTVTLSGLQVNIPPGGFNGDGHGGGGPSVGRAAIVVGKLFADDAVLALIPRKAGKSPRVFAVHHLTMDALGRGNSMPFEATITNPLPKGLVRSKGTFGPWRKDDPGSTPLSGRYTFDDVDLSTVKGIGGALSSTGQFGGQLDRIDVSGETRTPDFRVNVSGNPVPLQTKFEAVVDGTDGDTYLNAVSATFLRTALTAKGAIVGAEGVKGRTVKVHVKIDDGRIEDVLRLAVKGIDPLMTGRLALHADMNLPAGPADVMDRLELSGEFDVDAARFSDGGVQAKISDMSERARGLKPQEHEENVASNLQARFRLDHGVLSLQDGSFGIPGATVQIAGSYGLQTEALEFDGMLRMQATISEAAGGGLKSFFLKAVDPLFRKPGAGTVLPIRIRGHRSQPKFGLDVGKALTPR